LASEREHLGRILERDTHRKRTGRRVNKNARIAAKVALAFYRQWQRANKQVGISSWGHGDEMKDEACRCAIEIKPWLNGKEPDFEIVRELMERPNYRRNSK
jgi:hypothetical protein